MKVLCFINLKIFFILLFKGNFKPKISNYNLKYFTVIADLYTPVLYVHKKVQNDGIEFLPETFDISNLDYLIQQNS